VLRVGGSSWKLKIDTERLEEKENDVGEGSEGRREEKCINV